jgi:hypothetical protein
MSFRAEYLLILGLLNGVAILVGKSLLLHDSNGLVDGIQLGHGSSVGVPVVVGPCEVLAIVAGEVHVVERVVGGAVDKLLEPVAGNHVAIVDEDGPDLNADEEEHVEVLLHGADVDEDTVRVSRSSDCQIEARLTGKEEIERSRQQGGKQWQPKG